MFLMGATAFREHADVFNPLWVIRELKRLDGPPHRLLAPLTEAVQIAARDAGAGAGRRRGAGRFELAYLAFVFSRHADVRPWWQSAGHSIRRAAGFAERPSYPLTQLRFAELEHPAISAALEQLAGVLIQSARKATGGQIGRYLHVDGTEAETHARLKHVCPKGSPCWKARKDGTWQEQRKSASTPTTVVRGHRHVATAGPEPEDLTPCEDTEIGDADSIERTETGVIVTVGGCKWELLDPTAGVRAYITRGRVKRFWVGFYNSKVIDHFTGAPVAVRITSASTPEWVSYPRLLDAAIANVGEVPDAVVADRGFSVSSVFTHHTRMGIASVMPWRPAGPRRTRDLEDCDLHDRHGVVRCKHCGSPTQQVSFARSAGAGRGPRLYVQCVAPVTAGCAKRQSVACDASPRMLLPLWRTDPVYLALRNSHDRYERVHHHWRVRWRSGADDHALRPKRRGRECQQLRASAALLIEWLMICWREAWLPTSRPKGRPDPARIVVDDGEPAVAKLTAARRALGLDVPYGPAAVKLGLGAARPVRPVDLTPADPTEPPETPEPDEPTADGDAQPDRDAAHVVLDELPSDLPF